MFLSHSETWGFQPAHQSLSPITVSLRRFYRSAKSGALESDSVNQGLPGPRLGSAQGGSPHSTQCPPWGGPSFRRQEFWLLITHSRKVSWTLALFSDPMFPAQAPWALPRPVHSLQSILPCCQMSLLETPVTTLQLFTRTLDAHPSTSTE